MHSDPDLKYGRKQYKNSCESPAWKVPAPLPPPLLTRPATCWDTRPSFPPPASTAPACPQCEMRKWGGLWDGERTSVLPQNGACTATERATTRLCRCYKMVLLLQDGVATTRWFCYYKTVLLLQDGAATKRWCCYYKAVLLLQGGASTTRRCCYQDRHLLGYHQAQLPATRLHCSSLSTAWNEKEEVHGHRSRHKMMQLQSGATARRCFYYKTVVLTVFRIRIHLILIRTQHFRLNTGTDPDDD